MRVINGIEELQGLIGEELGCSDWTLIDQDRIQAFADATGDQQWIHVDVERARRESPLGAPIAHGFLTLSLLPMLNQQVFAVEGPRARLNYGLDKVRFPAPVPAGSRVRSRVTLLGVEPAGENRFLIRTQTQIELEGGERPVCVAEGLGMLVF